MPNNDYLVHYGILGMKWGVRRFETKSGHLTAAGKERYGDDGTSSKSAASATAKNKTTNLSWSLGQLALTMNYFCGM